MCTYIAKTNKKSLNFGRILLSFLNCELRFNVLRLAFLVIFLGCQSSSLVVDLPNNLNIELNPPYIEQDIQEVRVVFKDLKHQNTNIDLTQIDLLDWYFGPDVELDRWQAVSRFEIILYLRRLSNAPYGQYESKIVLQNDLGQFEGFGGLIVFP
jgi:hypothetical protein